MENGEEAEIISLESLMSSPIEKDGEELKEFNKDLENSLLGNSKSGDFLEITKEDDFEPEIKEKVISEEQEEEEEPKKEVVEKPIETISETTAKKIYRDTIKSLFGEDQVFTQEGEDGEDIEVSIDEYDVTADTLKELIERRIESEREKALEDKISTKGVSDFTKNLIEIEKNGGEIRDLLQYKDAYTDPLENLDLSTENGQMQAVALYLRGRQEPQDEIDIRIEAYRKRGILEEKATQFSKEIKESVNSLIEQRKLDSIEQRRQKEELFKSYRKDLDDELKNSFELKDTVRKKLLDHATKRDDNGEYELDKLYKIARSEPSTVALLSLFFEDKEEFIRQLSSKKVNEQRLKDQKAIKLGSKKTYDVEKVSKQKNDSNLILFSDLT